MRFIYCIVLLVYYTVILFFFFFNDTATTEIYTLSLHDALPIFERERGGLRRELLQVGHVDGDGALARADEVDRKSTRLNSSHSQISYAVFCLKKKKRTNYIHHTVNVRDSRCQIRRSIRPM